MKQNKKALKEQFIKSNYRTYDNYKNLSQSEKEQLMKIEKSTNVYLKFDQLSQTEIHHYAMISLEKMLQNNNVLGELTHTKTFDKNSLLVHISFNENANNYLKKGILENPMNYLRTLTDSLDMETELFYIIAFFSNNYFLDISESGLLFNFVDFDNKPEKYRQYDRYNLKEQLKQTKAA